MANGELVKRFIAVDHWEYIIKLDEPLSLDKYGFGETVRGKISTNYIMTNNCRIKDVYCHLEDPLFLEFEGGARWYELLGLKRKDGSIHVLTGYVESPEMVPNEIGKNDQAWKDFPLIGSGGWIRLIDEV